MKATKTYSATAGTAHVTFSRTRVPVSHTLGNVGHGLRTILSDFKHERWMVVGTSFGAQWSVIKECLKYDLQSTADH
jgi:alkylation response protein AidB-like acyl-CoA dehydrogenase